MYHTLLFIFIFLTSCAPKVETTNSAFNEPLSQTEDITPLKNNDSNKNLKSQTFTSSPKKETTPFRFSKVFHSNNEDSLYTVQFDNKTVNLKINTSTGLLKPHDLTTLPKKVDYKIQLTYLLTEMYPQKMDIFDIYNSLNYYFLEESSIKNFSDLSQDICFYKKDLQCLTSLVDWLNHYHKNLTPFDELNQVLKNKKSKVFLSLSLLSENWEQQRYYLDQALQEDSKNKKTKYFAQLFSIEMALKILTYYEDEVLKSGLNTAIGFSTAGDGDFHYGDALIEATANTYNLVRLISSHIFNDSFVKDIHTRWSISLKQIRSFKNRLKITKAKLIELKNLQSSDALILKNMSPEQIQTPFIQSLISTGIYQSTPSDDEDEEDILFPIIQMFNIQHISEFTQPELTQVLKEQINILNFVMLFRGPAMVQAFGKTKMGIQLVDKLRLTSMIHTLGKLKWPLNSLLVWVALETADGCFIRYTYVFYTVGEQISDDSRDKILESMKRDKPNTVGL